MPSYRAYMDRSVQLSVSCEQQDGISLVHCNANQSATTIQYIYIEILGAIRIEKNIEKEWHRLTGGPFLIFPHRRTPRFNTEDRFIYQAC